MSNQIIVSITTTPTRLSYLSSVIKSILQQTTKPDKIILNIPNKSKKSGKYYDIDLLKDYKNHPKILINRCEDYGPITKLIPTLYLDLSPDTLIVTVDDDIYLHPHTLSVISRKSKIHTQQVFSFSGICIGNFPFYWGLEASNSHDKQVDVVEGVHSIVYRKWMVDAQELLDFRELLRSTLGDIVDCNDDHVISAYLSHKNISKISINKRPKDYFFDLEHKNLGGISNRKLEFWLENIRISSYLKKMGYYYCNVNPKSTIGLYIFLIPFLFKKPILLSLWIILIYTILTTNIKLKTIKCQNL
jgi:hypothetical protein